MGTGVDFIDVKRTLECRFDDDCYNFVYAQNKCGRTDKLVCYTMRIGFE